MALPKEGSGGSGLRAHTRQSDLVRGDQGRNDDHPSESKGIRRLASQAGRDFKGGIILYGWASVLPIDRTLNLYAVPISKLWEL